VHACVHKDECMYVFVNIGVCTVCVLTSEYTRIISQAQVSRHNNMMVFKSRSYVNIHFLPKETGIYIAAGE
jgi:hypothetical protein